MRQLLVVCSLLLALLMMSALSANACHNEYSGTETYWECQLGDFDVDVDDGISSDIYGDRPGD